MKNPVAKNAPEFNKARVFRDRKTLAKETGDYKEHYKLQPYKREHVNLLLEWEDDSLMLEDDLPEYGHEYAKQDDHVCDEECERQLDEMLRRRFDGDYHKEWGREQEDE